MSSSTCLQGGPRADRYKWSELGSPYKWLKIHELHWFFFTSPTYRNRGPSVECFFPKFWRRKKNTSNQKTTVLVGG